MLTLLELRFKGIGCFVEEQCISFESLGNLIQVDGQNNTTGGSSGSGKSTIFNALAFLLGINSVPTTLLQSRRTQEHIWVQAKFDYDGQPLIITRGKKLKIELNGEVTEGSSKISEEKLDQIISIPRLLFKPMLYKEQRKPGFFLEFTPKQVNEFLTDCLGLSHFKKPLLDLDAKLLALTQTSQKIAVQIASIETGLEASQKAMASLGQPPVKPVDQKVILDLKAKADAASEAYSKVLLEQQKELDALEATRPALSKTPFDATNRLKYQQELQDIKEQNTRSLLAQKDKNAAHEKLIWTSKTKLSELEDKVDAGLDANKMALQYAAEIKKIRENMCPKCEQHWLTDSSKQEEERLLGEIGKLKEIILCGQKSTVQKEAEQANHDYLISNTPAAVPDDFKELREKERNVKNLIMEDTKLEALHLQSEHEANTQKQNDFAAQQRAVREAHALASDQLRGQVSITTKVFETAVMNLRSYETARIRYESSLASIQAQETEYTTKITSSKSELAVVLNDIECYEELKRATKTYLSCCFDEALETIGENATKLVRSIPNMANATIQLMGVWETKEGKVKEEVNAVLHLDGDENVDIRSFCGGERSAIDLAVDLSVIELIENKTNRGINVFVLDEPFSGLDTVCIEMALEVLKNSNSNKKLIIVDHNPEVKQMVESHIVVVRDGLTSQVVQK